MEKTMKTTARNSAVTALLLALSAAFVLAGCFNPIDPVNPAAQPGAGYLSVSIAGQGGGARTLYPSAVFTKYVLTFAAGDGNSNTYGPKTITGASSAAFNDIPAGTWTVTAVGYVTIDGREYAAAEGASAPVSISAGQPASVSIAISAGQGGDHGYFSYNVSFPAGKVTTATLTFRPFDTNYGDFGNPIATVDLKASTSGYIDDGEAGSGLAPGYYRVDVRLQNEFQGAGISEVVHIYSNMETKAEYAYTEADFVDFITLSGTITATINGEAPERVEITARTEEGNQIGYTYIDPYSDGTAWSIKVLPLGEATAVTFRVYLSGSSVGGYVPELSPIQVHNTPVSNISLNAAYSTVTLSGTFTAPANGGGEPYYWVEIGAYAGDNQIGSTFIDSPSDGASWSITIPAFSEETTVTFRVYLYGSSVNGSVSGLSPTQVHNTSVSDISLTYSNVTLSGTLNATINGEAPERVEITARTEEGNQIGRTSIDPYSDGAAWTINVLPLSEETAVTFRVYLYGSSVNGSVSDLSPIQVHNTPVSGISLNAVYSAVTLSGTFTAPANGDGEPYYWVEIGAYAGDNQIGFIYIGSPSADAPWSITIPAFSEETTVTFRVRLSGSSVDGSVSGLSPTQVHNTSVSDISLTYPNVTLSGTLNATIYGEAPERVEITAHTEEGNQIGRTSINPYSDGVAWSINVLPLSEETAVTFRVYLSSSNMSGGYLSGLSPIQVHDSAVSNISLNAEYTTVTLSGTVGSVAIDRVAPNFLIEAYKQNGESLSNTTSSGNGAWSLTIPASRLQSGDEISIRLYANFDGFSLYKTLTTRTYRGGDIADIALGDVAVTTRIVTGTITNLPDEAWHISVAALSAFPASGTQQERERHIIAQRSMYGGIGNSGGNAWVLKAPSGEPAALWYMVRVYGGELGQRYFVTSAASGASTVTLDISTMTELEQ